MSKILTNNQYYYQIADVIREQNGTSNTYKPAQMVSALKDLFYEEVEGAPPITFQGIGENLLDYRIDGASGGVGERTKNLFNFNEWSENLTVNANNELIISNNSVTITAVENDAFTRVNPNIYKIDVLPNSQYVLSWDSNNTLPGRIYVFKNGLSGSGNYINVNNAIQKYITFSTDGDTTFITIRFGVMNAGDSITYSHIQLEKGSTATDYEPYGYKVPVVCGGTTTNIYLDKPIEAKANIPSEYEEVEYIESTGTQYIDTGININTTTSRYETKINPSSVSDASGIFGTRNNTTADVRSMNIFIINGAFRLDWLSGTALSEINISPNTEYTISITRGLATINNVDYTSEQTTSVNGLYTFYIGNFNNAGRPFSNGFSGKIYYSKLYNKNILVFDGVPCYRKSDNVAGLYDLVNNTFYTNQGTGNFIVGSIKENESISLSDTNVDIPTIRGTNVLTVDTTVQPSNVYVKSRHESSYEAAMRERYEEAQAQLDALENGGE